jgi:4-amino-4-deoxy-L-arabinose transferase-like glycosyltransferase
MLNFHPVNSPSLLRTRSSEEGPAQISWLAALLALIVVLTCVFSGLGALGLTGPDEPRYMDVARAMLRSGDWVTPRLYGQPWFEKPVLIYWAAAASFRVFGINDFAARLPAALAALFAILVAAWAALRSYGLDAAWLTLLLMPTTVASIGLGRAASPDMLFSSLLIAAAVAAVEMLSTDRPGASSRLAFGGFLAAATLAKGPAAIVLAGGAAFLWVLVSRQWQAVFRLIHPLCVAAFFAVAAPWYVLCALRNPDFLRVFILEQNVSRYLTNVFDHPEPSWFFVAVLLAAIAPWTFLVLPPVGRAVANLRAGQKWRNSPALFYGCWAAFPVLFFSFSKSKLPGYVLPAVPPLILVVASALSSLLRERTPEARWWIALAASMLPVPLVVSIFWIHHFPAVLGLTGSRVPDVLAVGAIVGSLACIAAAFAGRPRFALALEATLATTLLVATNSWILPKLDPFLSAREAARSTPREALESGHLATLGLSRSWQYGLNFYLDRELPQWNPSMGADSWVWTTEQRAGALQAKAKISTIERISAEAWLLRIDANREGVPDAETAAAKRD